LRSPPAAPAHGGGFHPGSSRRASPSRRGGEVASGPSRKLRPGGPGPGGDRKPQPTGKDCICSQGFTGNADARDLSDPRALPNHGKASLHVGAAQTARSAPRTKALNGFVKARVKSVEELQTLQRLGWPAVECKRGAVCS